MEIKLLYTVGNLFTGYPWGVEGVRPFDVVEVHGPFSSELEAQNYMHQLVEVPVTDGMPFVSLKVVKIETPQVGKVIVLKDDQYQYQT